jgi:hypothetical protein
MPIFGRRNIVKPRDILTAVVMMLAHMGSTAKFVATDENDIVIRPNAVSANNVGSDPSTDLGVDVTGIGGVTINMASN